MHTNRFKTNKLTIDKEHNAELYDTIIAQLQKVAYNSIPIVKTLTNKLISKKHVFTDLTVLQQCKVLLNCITFLRKSTAVDLSLLGEKTCGRTRINNNITNCNVELIYRSATGLSERIRKV